MKNFPAYRVRNRNEWSDAIATLRLVVAPSVALSLGLALLLVLWLVLWTAASVAQQDFSKVEIKTTSLGGGIAMLQGSGGNIGVSTGPDGVFMIDDQYAPLSEKIRKAIRALSTEPIRFIVNTHWHGDHTGGNENLAQSGALILAHQRVRTRLSTDQHLSLGDRDVPASAIGAWPDVTFEDGVTMYLNGQTIEVMHVEPAHTDGDSIVYFREADVLHMGDTFFSGIYPLIDTSSGGDIDGMVAAADRGLAIAGPKTQIIPGHGPLSSRADLVRTRDMLILVRDRVRKLIDSGHDQAAVIAAKPTQELDHIYGGGFMTPDRFVGIVYQSLKSK